MRFIHTADWHLGRSFFNTSLLEDQSYVLNQLIDFAKDANPDVIIISGDIYDRALPPTEAIQLLDDVLCRLILDYKLPIIVVGGNHDSPLRIEFAARLLETLLLRIYGSLSERLDAIDMFDEWGMVTFFPLPYAEPSFTRGHFQDDGIISFEDALRRWLIRLNEKHPVYSRSVLIHHAFVAGGEISESERPFDVGGADMVSAECFDTFNYAALGHLHRKQDLGQKRNIHYPGSLLKYSFSEVKQTKGFNFVEMDAKGKCQFESIPLTPKHDVRRVEGTLDDILREKVELGNRNDYVQVCLRDTGAVYEAMNRLREVYPNIASVDHTGMMPVIGDISRIDIRERDIYGLFRDFYLLVTGEELTKEQLKVFSDIANQAQESERMS